MYCSFFSLSLTNNRPRYFFNQELKNDIEAAEAKNGLKGLMMRVAGKTGSSSSAKDSDTKNIPTAPTLKNLMSKIGKVKKGADGLPQASDGTSTGTGAGTDTDTSADARPENAGGSAQLSKSAEEPKKGFFGKISLKRGKSNKKR